MPALDPETLLYAYSQGYFPMGDPDDGEVYWYDPDPRAVIPLESFHVPRRLERTLRQGRFALRFDTAFREVMALCAAPAPGRESTWITPELLEAYTRLHELGFAHSAEAWREGRLVGGVYGVSLRGLFAGESMFSREQSASKAALVFLLGHLRARGYALFDAQFMNPHLRQFGAAELPRRVYKARLAAALARPVTFG
jgi:leucyl/phenylalanyl-tRNA---protein transferase